MAWSTFATGVNPGQAQHLRLPQPQPEVLCAGALLLARASRRRASCKLGQYRIPLSRPTVEMRRKSQPFWKILGEHADRLHHPRVPITFPPEKFNGRLLSAMCTPDLRGTQGSSRSSRRARRRMRGRQPLTARRDERSRRNRWRGDLDGPGASAITTPVHASPDAAQLNSTIARRAPRSEHGEYTPWVRLRFRAAFGIKVSGIARSC